MFPIDARAFVFQSLSDVTPRNTSFMSEITQHETKNYLLCVVPHKPLQFTNMFGTRARLSLCDRVCNSSKRKVQPAGLDAHQTSRYKPNCTTISISAWAHVSFALMHENVLHIWRGNSSPLDVWWVITWNLSWCLVSPKRIFRNWARVPVTSHVDFSALSNAENWLWTWILP